MFGPLIARYIPSSQLALKVRCVPEAEVNPGILNVGLWEIWPSDIIAQSPQCAQSRRVQASLMLPLVQDLEDRW